MSLAKTPSARNCPRVTLLHLHILKPFWEQAGMLGFGKLLIRKVLRERGVLTRDRG